MLVAFSLLQWEYCFVYNSKKEIKLLLFQENLAVVYTTCCPGQYTIYEPVIRLKGQVKTVPSQRPFSLKEVQSNVLDSHHLKTLQPVEYKTLQGILHEIGGTGAFVFLFARVRRLKKGGVLVFSHVIFSLGLGCEITCSDCLAVVCM